MDSVLHFAFGVAIGTAAYVPWIGVRIKRGMPVAAHVCRMLIVSYGLGVVAVGPSILVRIGVPEVALAGAWTNVFLLHEVLDSVRTGGMLIGSLATVACFVVQYLTVVIGIRAASSLRVA